MDDVEAFKKAIMLGRGDEIAGMKIKKKGVVGTGERSDHFGFWMEDDGFLSLPNAIAKLRPVVPKYACAHCGVESPKDEWGPGLVTCPRCGEFAPSAAETAEAATVIVAPELDPVATILVVGCVAHSAEPGEACWTKGNAVRSQDFFCASRIRALASSPGAQPTPVDPVCETCGGAKVVIEFIDRGASGYDAQRPCPTCTPSSTPAKGPW